MHRQYARNSLVFLIRVEHFLNRLINILVLTNRFLTSRIMSSSSISRLSRPSRRMQCISILRRERERSYERWSDRNRVQRNIIRWVVYTQYSLVHADLGIITSLLDLFFLWALVFYLKQLKLNTVSYICINKIFPIINLGLFFICQHLWFFVSFRLSLVASIPTSVLVSVVQKTLVFGVGIDPALVHSLNKISPRYDTCGTPYFTATHLSCGPATGILDVLCWPQQIASDSLKWGVRQAVRHYNTCSRRNSTSWSTESNADDWMKSLAPPPMHVLSCMTMKQNYAKF